MNTKEKGKLAEDAVVKYLIERGYEIVERNFHCIYGETDIICKKDMVLCIVEVKTFPAGWDKSDIRKSVNGAKMKRIKTTASCFLESYSGRKYNKIRFDVAVFNEKSGIDYYEGAF